MIYLFIGNDEIAKQRKVQDLKKQLFNSHIESFNCETLYAKDLSPLALKESLCRLPAASTNRLLIVKDVSKLKENLKTYFFEQIKSLPKYLILVLETSLMAKGDSFIGELAKIAKVFSFKKEERKDVFALAKVIEHRQTEYALNLLVDLFRAGERPEKILGGLRYHFMKSPRPLNDKIKIISSLLETDIKIKTGRLKSQFALETLVVRLCR